MNSFITKYCHIKNNRLFLKGQLVFEDPAAVTFGEFIRSAYKFVGMAYPKFYKMDNTCKLALVAAELILKGTHVIEQHGKDKIGLIIQNASSTIDTDTEFQSTINERSNYFPSPAVFVYTLPNIMLGEICIKQKIFGENALLIESSFDPKALCAHLDILFEQKRIHAALTGWIEQSGNDYEAFMLLAENEGHDAYGLCSPFDEEQVNLKFNESNNN